MKLQYKLTNSDFLALLLYSSSRSKTQIKNRRNSRYIFSVSLFLFGVLTNKKGNYIDIIIFGIATIILFFLYPKYSQWKYKKHFKKHIKENYKNRINKSVEISFNEGNIVAKDYTSETKIKGSELKELIEVKQYFFIKLTTDLFLIVPKYAIESMETFKNTILQFGAKYINELEWKWN